MGLDSEFFFFKRKKVPIVFPQVFGDIPNNVPHVLNVLPQEVPNKTTFLPIYVLPKVQIL